jgi:hypothetical protein
MPRSFAESLLDPVPSPPEYPPGGFIWSSSPAVDRKTGTILGYEGAMSGCRRILWGDGSLSSEGLLYLRAHYRDVATEEAWSRLEDF